MRMIIDEAIPILHDMYNYYNDTDIDAYVGFDKEDNDAIETALDTMRKYQMMQADHKAEMVGMLKEIREEIVEHAYPIVHGVNNREKGMTLYGILQVLDKKISELEGAE